MKKVIFIFCLITLSMYACGQRQDGDFKTPITVVKIIFSDSTFMTTAVGEAITWDKLVGKPLFSKVALTGSYADLINEPGEIDLVDAIEQMGYLPIPQKTTTEINTIILPVGKSGIVYDKTLKVYKYWDSVTSTWSKIAITNQ